MNLFFVVMTGRGKLVGEDGGELVRGRLVGNNGCGYTDTVYYISDICELSYMCMLDEVFFLRFFCSIIIGFFFLFFFFMLCHILRTVHVQFGLPLFLLLFSFERIYI